MEKIELEVKTRDTEKKDKNLNQLRSQGWIPAVIYGHGNPESVAIEARAFQKAIHTKAGTNALFTIKLGEKKSLSVIKEIQRHILSHQPIHIDFQRVDVKQKLEVNVPTKIVGEAPGVKGSGGILEHITREIRVRCLPSDIPAAIDVDVSRHEHGHGIKVQEITPPPGVEFVTTGDHIVVNVVAPKAEEVAPAPAAATEVAGAEPEVISKGKKEEEGAAGTVPAPGGAAPAAAAPAAKGKEEKKN